ncbi:unnamed protein product [Ectocarpus sp. 12 AP-2014]
MAQTRTIRASKRKMNRRLLNSKSISLVRVGTFALHPKPRWPIALDESICDFIESVVCLGKGPANAFLSPLIGSAFLFASRAQPYTALNPNVANPLQTAY